MHQLVVLVELHVLFIEQLADTLVEDLARGDAEIHDLLFLLRLERILFNPELLF